MYKKILVPLDGSKLAESALPYAEEIAKGCNISEIMLVSVTERVTGQTWAPETQMAYRSSDRADLHGAGSEVTLTFGKEEKQARKYLGKIAKILVDKGIPARTEVLIGSPAEKIVSFAGDNAADVIVMSSHGRSGPSRWAHGSVADKVLRASCVPVLMVRAPGCMTGI